MVIWVTGLSGAGKTTLCKAFWELAKPHLPALVLLDGDEVREAFGHNLSYKEEDRILQVRRLQSMAQLLSRQSCIVVVGVLYNNPELLLWNRENFDDYFEVYLDASMNFIIEQDAKGLYAAAQKGKESNVVGVDIEWHIPVRPDLIFNADLREKPYKMAEQLIRNIPILARKIKV